MQLLLNIYDPETKIIAKQQKAESVDIMFGTIEDLIEIIDIDKLSEDNDTELTKIILMSIKKVKPLLKEVFTGLSDDELKNTKIKELIPLFIDIVKYMFTEIKVLGGDSKNQIRVGITYPYMMNFFVLP